MTYHPESLTPDDYVMYRLARFGEAGRYGEKGAKQAGRRHGVSARAWMYYESGHRQPSVTQRKVIASWLDTHARADERRQEVEEGPVPTTTTEPA